MRAVSGGPRWKARLARALGLDGNPLRRASDRAEAWIRAGLLAILLTAGPIAALAAGQWSAHAAGAGTSVQPHAVQAVLLQPATAPAGPAAAGTAVTVWLTASGRVTSPPQRGGFVFAAVLTAMMTLIVTAFALLVVLRLIQRFLNWRRLAAWEAAWRATGPRWTGHRS